MKDIESIAADFDLLEDWEDRYRYLIELGRELPRLAEGERIDANKVSGCASQVWLIAKSTGEGRDQRMSWRGESDAHIVQGLIALLLALHRGKTPDDVLATDALAFFKRLGLSEHLTPQRSNGLRSMVERIRADARRALSAAGRIAAAAEGIPSGDDATTDHSRR